MSNMREQKKVCGTCQHHHPDRGDDGTWYCDNFDSDYWMDTTMYNDTCDDWEGKE